MARFLFASQPIIGHVAPALGIVRQLTERGHEVRWYVGEKFRSQIEDVGAGFEGYRAAYDYDDSDYDAAFPGRSSLHGLRQIRWDFEHVFIKQSYSQHQDLRAILDRRPAGVVVGEPSLFAPFSINERGGPPNAVYNITCLGISGHGVAPFGLGLLPTDSAVGLLRNRILDFLAPNVVFGNVSRALADQCRQIGVKPRKFTGVLISPYLFIQPTVEGFEYPRADLPRQVHFVGALLSEAPTRFRQPQWWEQVVAKTQPVVLVTQGTVATDARALIAPTLRGLANDDVFVIAAGVRGAARRGLEPVPDNARVEGFVPFKPLMPYVDVYITNGGFGGVQHALSNGVPIITAGATEDKPEIGNRVAFAGAGINLKTSSPTPQAIGHAVRTILTGDSHRQQATALQAELAGHNASVEAADLLEQLHDTQVPILRSQAPPGRHGVPSMVRSR